MNKIKGTEAGKVGGNSPIGATVGDTSRSRAGGQMPSTAPLPTMADQQPWLTVGGSVTMPTTQETGTLPMFSATAGNTDTGASSSGDVGGARG